MRNKMSDGIIPRRKECTGGGDRSVRQVAGPLAISAKNSSLLFVVRILSMSSSRPAAARPSLARALSTRRSFHTCWS